MGKAINLTAIFLLIFALMFSFTNSAVLADEDNGNDDSSDSSDNSGNGDDDDDNTENDEEDNDEDEDNEGSGRERNRLMREFNAADGSRIRVEREVKIEDGKTVIEIRKKIVSADGEEIEVRIKIIEKEGDLRIKKVLKIDSEDGDEDFEVESELELEEDETNETEVVAVTSNGTRKKIKILPDEASEIAREKLLARGFEIELKESVHKNIPRVVYNIETNKNGKFLGIFKLKMKVEGEIDPETGEFLGTSKPWWAFLVTGEDSDQTEEEEDDEETEELVVNLLEQNELGESGTATLAEENEQIIVTIRTTGFQEGVEQPAHIHEGSCPDIGSVVYPLNNVLNGESVTTLDITLEQLETELPLGINVHKSVEEASIYATCGDILF